MEKMKIGGKLSLDDGRKIHTRPTTCSLTLARATAAREDAEKSHTTHNKVREKARERGKLCEFFPTSANDAVT